MKVRTARLEGLPEVLATHKRHKATLGPLVDEVFKRAIEQEMLLVVSVDEGVAGYLLWRQTRQDVVITHLCRDETLRGQGAVDPLWAEFLRRIPPSRNVRLNCRADYAAANRLWPRLGFVARTERRGRSKAGHSLVRWVLERSDRPPLLRLLDEQRLAGKLQVVIDANGFFDLAAEEQGRSDEVKALCADWLSSTVELCITPELSNEIGRNQNSESRRLERIRAERFVEVTGSDWRQHLKTLKALLPAGKRVQDASDRRQLAHAIAGGADYFVTRDTVILDRADELEAELGIRIMRPLGLLLALHEDEEGSSYSPARFAGTTLKRKRVAQEDHRAVELRFQRFREREPKKDWLALVRPLLQSPQDIETQLIGPASEEPLVLLALRRDGGRLTLPLCRTMESSRAGTVLQAALVDLLDTARREGVRDIRVGDIGTDRIRTAVENLGFDLDPGGSAARKLLIDHVAPKARWAELTASRSAESASIPDLPDDWFTLEQRFWPGKVMDAGAPCYLVPIKPRWAADLFDVGLAHQLLFGGRSDLLFRLENVFYRSAAVQQHAPARILWYVSGDVGAIRAVSFLEESIVEPARDLFRRFERLGVYEWRHVLGLAGADPNGLVQALRFSQTEQVRSRVGFQAIQAVLVSSGKPRNQLQQPLRIEETVFFELYEMAMRSRNGG